MKLTHHLAVAATLIALLAFAMAAPLTVKAATNVDDVDTIKVSVDETTNVVTGISLNGNSAIITCDEDGSIVVYKDTDGDGQIDADKATFDIASNSGVSSYLRVVGLEKQEKTGDMTITISGVTCQTVYGLTNGSTLEGDLTINYEDCTVTYSYGVSSSSVTGNVNFSATSAYITGYMYVAMSSSTISEDVNVSLKNSTMANPAYLIHGSSVVTGNVTVNIDTCTFPSSSMNSVAYQSTVGGNVTTTVTNSFFATFYMLNSSTVGGDATFTADRLTISSSFYMAYSGSIGGDATMNIAGGTEDEESYNGLITSGTVYFYFLSHCSVTGEAACSIKNISFTGYAPTIYGVYGYSVTIGKNFTFTVEDSTNSTDAVSTGSGQIKAVEGSKISGDCTVSVTNAVSSLVYGIYTQGTVGGNYTANIKNCTGTSSTSSDCGVFGSYRNYAIGGSATVNIENCNYYYIIYGLYAYSSTTTYAVSGKASISIKNCQVLYKCYGAYYVSFLNGADISLDQVTTLKSSYTSYIYGTYDVTSAYFVGDLNVSVTNCTCANRIYGICSAGTSGSSGNGKATVTVENCTASGIDSSYGGYIYYIITFGWQGDVDVIAGGNKASNIYGLYTTYITGDVSIDEKSVDGTGTTCHDSRYGTELMSYYIAYYSTISGAVKASIADITTEVLYGLYYCSLSGNADVAVSNATVKLHSQNVYYYYSEIYLFNPNGSYGVDINFTFDNCTFDTTADEDYDNPFLILALTYADHISATFTNCTVNGTLGVLPQTYSYTTSGTSVIKFNDDIYYGGMYTFSEDVTTTGNIYIGNAALGNSGYQYGYCQASVPAGVTLTANNIYVSKGCVLLNKGTLATSGILYPDNNLIGSLYVNGGTTSATTVTTDVYALLETSYDEDCGTVTITSSTATTVLDTGVTYALVDDDVTFTITPFAGYKVGTVTCGDDVVTCDDDVYTASMPSTGAVLSVTFEEDPITVDEESSEISLNASSVVIEELSDGTTAIYLDKDNDGVKDSSEYLYAGDLSGFTIYGVKNATTAKRFTITMVSGTVGTIYGMYYGTSTYAGDDDAYVLTFTGGTVSKLYICLTSTIAGTMAAIATEDATITSKSGAMNSSSYTGYYTNYSGAYNVYGDYTFNFDIEGASLFMYDNCYNVTFNGDIKVTGSIQGSGYNRSSSKKLNLTYNGSVEAENLYLTTYVCHYFYGDLTINNQVSLSMSGSSGYGYMYVYGKAYIASYTNTTNYYGYIYLYENSDVTIGEISSTYSSNPYIYQYGKCTYTGDSITFGGNWYLFEGSELSISEDLTISNLYCYLATENSKDSITVTCSGTTTTAESTKLYKAGTDVTVTLSSLIDGYNIYGTIDGGETYLNEAGETSMTFTMPYAATTFALVYEGTEIEVSDFDEEDIPVAEIGGTYTEDSPLVDFGSLEISGDCVSSVGDDVTYEVVGTLPNGLELTEDGKIVGTFSEYLEETTITVAITGSNGYTVEKSVTITVDAASHSHTYDSGVVTTAATTSSTGVKTYTCTVCNATKTETIDKLTETTTTSDSSSSGSTSTESQTNSSTSTSTSTTSTTTTTTTATAVAVGTVIKDATGSSYKVTVSGSSPTVTLTKASSSLKGKVTIDTVTINGVTYKVTAIGAKAFKGNKKITSVVLGSGVKTIGASAFEKCTSLKSVTAKCKTLKKIGKKAFSGCKKLKTVKLKTTKLTKKAVGKKAFAGIAAKCTFKVPKKYIASYKKIFIAKGAKKSIKVKKG